jgi:tripartite-type tricarboxylate transporter receptor subunit TctC
LILAVNPTAVKADSVKEFVDAAKRQPGKIDYGAPGPGSPIHLAMEFFKQRAGITMTPIPYKGGADAMNDLIGGRIAAMFPDIASGLPQIRGGKIKALAVASAKRVAALPDLPTIGESGYPGFEAWAWQGFVAPAGTPREVVMKLNSEFAKVMNDAAIKQRLSESGFEPQTSTPEQFTAYLKAEIEKWRKVIRESNVSLD